MARIHQWVCLCLALLITLSLAGCAATESPADLLEQMIGDLPDAQTDKLPDEILTNNDIYYIHRVDGRCYLSFWKGNEQLDNRYDGGCVIPSSELSFYSLEEMYNKLLNGKLTEWELEGIQKSFTLVEGYGFLIADLGRLYVPELPAELELSGVRLDGADYTVYFRSKDRDADPLVSGAFQVRSRTYFENDLTYYNRFRTGSTTYSKIKKSNGGNTISYNYYGTWGRSRETQYRIEVEGKRFFISECCEIITTVFESTPDIDSMTVNIYGYDNGQFFTIRDISLGDYPSAEWLTSFGITEYVPE